MTREEKRAIRLQRAEEMAHLFRQGLDMQAIGAKYGITRERVRQLLGEIGLTGKDSGKRAMKAAAVEAKRDAFEMRIRAKWGVSIPEWRELRATGVIRAYEEHRRNSRCRAIPFRLTFFQWLSIWRVSGKLDLRGKGKGHYCMSRINDAGAYEVGNVHIQPCEDNSREATKQWIGKEKKYCGVYCLYPGLPRPFLAKVSRKPIGYFATAEEANAARLAYIAEHNINVRSNRLGGGKGWQINNKNATNPYQVIVRRKYIGSFATPEEAHAAYLAECERIKAEQSSSLASVSTLEGREFPGAVSDQVAGAGSFIRGDELIHGSHLLVGLTGTSTGPSTGNS